MQLGGLRHQRGQVGRPSLTEQRGDAICCVARVRNDEQATAGKQAAALAVDVGRLNACPRLHECNGRCARLLADRDEEPFSGSGLDNHPLIQEDVFLQPALEVVAEGGVRGRRQEVPVVRLDKAPFADAMAAHLVSHGDDAPNRLVPGDREQPTRRIRGDLGQHFRVDFREDRALSGVARERMQQLRVGEADPARFHPHEDLVRSRPRYRLLAVVDRPSGVDYLDRVLGGGNGPRVRLPSGHSLAPRYFSITWPPVTGMAWPVSYRWATT